MSINDTFYCLKYLVVDARQVSITPKAILTNLKLKNDVGEQTLVDMRDVNIKHSYVRLNFVYPHIYCGKQSVFVETDLCCLGFYSK